MKPTRLHFWLFLLLLIALGNTMQEEKAHFRPGKDYALFFAVDDYVDNRDFSNLRNPTKDADAIAAELRTMYDFETEVHKNLTKAEIFMVMERWQKKHFPEDAQLFIFFSGHGTFWEFTKKGYFVPKGNQNSYDAYLELTDLGNIVTQIPCKHILLAIDACYSGTIDQAIAFKGNESFRRPNQNKETERDNLIFRQLRNPSRLLLTSGGKERTPDGTDHSPFSAAILKGLRAAYTYGDGLFTFADLLSAVERVSPTPHHGELPGHEQGGFIFVNANSNSQPSDNRTINTSPLPTARQTEEASGLTIARPNMVPIDKISFRMGSNLGEAEPLGASPAHLVDLDGFSLSSTEVTFAEFDRFCEKTGREKPSDSGWGRGDLPVINISWFDAIAYCNWLSQTLNLMPVYQINGNQVTMNPAANGYRLPTEAEWEAASRWNNEDALFANGQNEADPSDLNFDPTDYRRYSYATNGVFRKKTLPVKSLTPNNGFYHLSGNVAEWCYDNFSFSYYRSSPRANPQGPYGSMEKVVRGGSWASNPSELRVWVRKGHGATYRSSQIGFRLAQTLGI